MEKYLKVPLPNQIDHVMVDQELLSDISISSPIPIRNPYKIIHGKIICLLKSMRMILPHSQDVP